MAEDNKLFSGLSEETLRNAERIRDTVGEIQKQFKRVNQAGSETNDTYNQAKSILDEIGKAASSVGKLQKSVTSSTKATRDAIQKSNDQLRLSATLQARIDNLLDEAATASKEDAENLEKKAKLLFDAKEQANELKSAFEKIAEDSAALDKSAGFFNSLSSLVGDIPGLRKFAGPFQDASKAAKETALNNAKTNKTMSTLGAGTKAFGKSLAGAAKAFLPLLLINTVIKAFKFVAELFVAADEETTQIGKNLGISKANAEGIRKEFVRIALSSSNVLATSKALLEAQSDLVKFSGAVTLQSFKQADAQVLLTKNLGIAGENAAMFQSLLGASNATLGGVIENTRVLADEQLASNGYFISNQEVLKEIANTSAEISGYYGFNVDNLAKAVYQTRRFGLSLQNAKNISEGLLNFEESISSELELELLSGRQFNLERARSLALTGDLAGATQEVMTEMSKLTAKQRQNPILMKSFAQLTGLSAEELNRAYLIQNNLNASTREYTRRLRENGQEEKARIAEELGLQGLNQTQIEKNISAQEKFNANLEKAKNQFSALVDSKVIDKLADLLTDFVERAGQVGIGSALMGFGKSSVEMNKNFAGKQSFYLNDQIEKGSEEESKQLLKLINTTARSRNLTQQSLNELVEGYGEAAKTAFLTAKKSADYNIVRGLEGLELKKEAEAKAEEPKMATGGIVTRPTRALVGEAGSEAVIPLREFYAKMDQMIAAVNAGKIINLDGRRVNENLSLASSKFDRR